VIADRCYQARVVNAVEPEWEARFEPRSYGFRPGRGCHDAIRAVFEVAKGKSPKRPWVLDADLGGALDRIAHDHILAMLGTFPAQGMIRQWLKAGVVEQGRLHRAEEGTPQGGVVSPVLLNIALHGMQTVAGARYTTGKQAGRIMEEEVEAHLLPEQGLPVQSRMIVHLQAHGERLSRPPSVRPMRCQRQMSAVPGYIRRSPHEGQRGQVQRIYCRCRLGCAIPKDDRADSAPCQAIVLQRAHVGYFV
jgi:hypothetical protein